MPDRIVPPEIVEGYRQLCETPPNVRAYERTCSALGWSPTRYASYPEECFEVCLPDPFYRVIVCFDGLDCYAATCIEYLDTSGFVDDGDEPVTNLDEFDERFMANRAAIIHCLGTPTFEGKYVAGRFGVGRAFRYAGWSYSMGYLTIVQHDEGDLGTEATLDLRIVRVDEHEVPRFPLQTSILM